MRAFVAVVLLFAPATALAQVPELTITQEALQEVLDTVRTKSRVPALGAAIVTSKGLHALAVTGVRKAGTKIKVTEDDIWHLGSDSKMFTGVLLKALEEKKLIYLDTALEEAFPSLAKKMNENYRKVTFDQMLRHKGGLVANLPNRWRGINSTMALPAQRQQAVRLGLALKPAADPGEKTVYSNLAWVTAVAFAESKTKQPYEILIRDRVLVPLGIKDAGFGPPGTPGRIDQPLLHDGKGVPHEPLPTSDNPPVMTPSARLHMSLRSWGLFAQDQLLGAQGKGKLLSAEGYKWQHTAAKGDTYTPGGWAVAYSPEVGSILNHDGSNSGNFCRALLIPKVDVAILLVTNIGPKHGDAAIQDATQRILPLLFAKASKK